MHCADNLKQIAIALHTYHDTYKSLPPAYIPDQNGKPMHSWRVLLLPFFEPQSFYQQYDFSEPWNGPYNIKLANLFSEVYQCPEEQHRGKPVQTSYLAVVGPGTMWPGSKPACFKDAKDGLSNVMMIVEVHNSGIQIFEPRDLDISTMATRINTKGGLGISSDHVKGAQVVFADGSVHFLDESTTWATLQKLIGVNDGSPKSDEY